MKKSLLTLMAVFALGFISQQLLAQACAHNCLFMADTDRCMETPNDPTHKCTLYPSSMGGFMCRGEMDGCRSYVGPLVPGGGGGEACIDPINFDVCFISYSEENDSSQ